MSDEQQILEAIFENGKPHKHCYSCHSFTRCPRPKADSCDYTQCPNNCGASFHQCKQELHDEICPNVTVSCINKILGCPLEILRKEINAHLEKCPASVVVCMAEWNRWPVYTVQRRKHIPFKQHNPHGHEGQLDYDLTLRDQRMLENLKSIPRKTKLSLRNNLTRRFPAVPIPSLKKSYDLKNDKDFMDLGLRDPYVGANRKIDKNLLQIQQWEEDLNARLKGKEIPKKYWEFPELERGNIHKHCAYCIDRDCMRKFYLENCSGAAEATTEGQNHGIEEACGMIECRWKCGAKYHACKSGEHSIICSKYEEEDEYRWMLQGVTNLEVRFEEIYKKNKKKAKNAMKEEKSYDCSDFFQGPGEPAKRPVKNAKGVPKAPELPKNLFKPRMWLDMKLETVTRLQTKPKQMYTFVCAQEFRRDEFAWHSKAVHNDILGGMNNWLEHRCPLAVYGCGFSHRRMFPGETETLIFSPAVESFGITNTDCLQFPPEKKGHKTSKTLTDLPFEILLEIVLHLDSFSICNLAVTSVYLRQVCCSLLDTKGCVTLQWERLKLKDGSFKWDVAYKRWFFSTSLGPIDRWTFSARQAISEHLKDCPFNVRTKHKDMKKLDKKWPEVMTSLQKRLEEKRQSIFFIQ